jgi:hypothetical protein
MRRATDARETGKRMVPTAHSSGLVQALIRDRALNAVALEKCRPQLPRNARGSRHGTVSCHGE